MVEMFFGATIMLIGIFVGFAMGSSKSRKVDDGD